MFRAVIKDHYMLGPPKGFFDRAGNTKKIIGQLAGNTTMKQNKTLTLKPGKSISETVLIQLKKANLDYSDSKNFFKYTRDIQMIFCLLPVINPTLNCKFYVAGFLEGEGSLNVGIKKNTTSKFKLYLDPEFNLTQHVNGISNLYLAMMIFKTGRIRFKSGSLATFVYTIDNRLSLEQKVIPFYEHYVFLYGCEHKKQRVHLFKTLLSLFKQKKHLDLDQMLYTVLPLWSTLCVQINHSNQTFKHLKEAQTYVKKAAMFLE